MSIPCYKILAPAKADEAGVFCECRVGAFRRASHEISPVLFKKLRVWFLSYLVVFGAYAGVGPQVATRTDTGDR